jgi:hypothetical protein
MELPLFEQVDDLVRALTPDELGLLHTRAHRRGIKVWFDTAKPGREHYEAQLLARRHVDGADGTALEIGFHAEHPDVDANQAAVDTLGGSEKRWRKILGADAEIGPFYGAENWRRVSEAWLEPDLEDPELSFEVASRLVDYLEALEPARR